MKNFPRFSFAAIAVATAFFSNIMLVAAPSVYEPFHYSSGVLTGQNGGTGFASGWVASRGTNDQGAVWDEVVNATFPGESPSLFWNGVLNNGFPTLPATGARFAGATTSGSSGLHISRTLSSSAGALAGPDGVLWLSAVYHVANASFGAGINLGLGSGYVYDRGRYFSVAASGAASNTVSFIGVNGYTGSAWNYRVNPMVTRGSWTAGNFAWTPGTTNLTTTADMIIVLKYTFGASDKVEAAYFTENETVSEAAFQTRKVSATLAAGINENTLTVLSIAQSRMANAIDEIRLGKTFTDVISPGISDPAYEAWAAQYPGVGLPDEDNDGDGLINSFERTLGTNPMLWDTDGDGFSDGVKIPGYLDLDVWTGITGNAVKDLTASAKYTTAPDTATFATATLTTLGLNYGARLRGTITAPETGDYVFYLAGDEQAELWLSPTDSPFAKRKIAHSTTKTNPQQWLTGTRQSAGIRLLQGQSYYIESLVKNATGTDHLSIGWSRIGQNEWQTTHIGTATTATWTPNASTGTVTSTTTGGDIRFTSDNFTFRSISLQGDSELIARVTAIDSPNASAKAGLMFRASLAPDSAFAYLHRAKDGRLSLHYRSATAAQSASAGALGIGSPYQWLRLSRTGNTFTAAYSLDGQSWLNVGTCTIPMGQTAAAGMATASTAANVPVTATWENIGFTDLTRVAPIPTSALTSFTPNPLDLDDDSLPDAWETAAGLSPSTAANAMGQYGNPDGDNLNNYEEYLLGSNPLVNGNTPGQLTRELWPALTASTMRDAVTTTTFLQGTSQITLLPSSEQLTLGNTNGLQRVRGQITAPATGQYRFWISGYSDCELWINPAGPSKFGKQKLASLYEHAPGGSYLVGFRGWDAYATQRSEPIPLQAGEKYYIEILQKHTQGSGNFSVAWNYTTANSYQTTRTLIPPTQLNSYSPHPDDTDDDYLPNSWESQNGLSTTDNGLTDPTRQGEYGDHDSDGLTNREEYLLGTHPTLPDTDADGWSDSDEINVYHTNPLISNQVSFATVATPPPGQYTTATGAWTLHTNGTLTAADRRGTITYSFTLPQAGVHEVILTGAATGTLRTVETLPIRFTIDGQPPLPPTTLVSVNGGTGTAKALTPWLTAGPHTLTILHDNYRTARRLRIDSLEINRLGGSDLDADGIPDWIKTAALATNTLTQAPLQSRTSPACVEGLTQNLSQTTLTWSADFSPPTSLPLTPSINGTFYTNVPLSPTAAVTLNASFLGGLHTETKAITWTATNLFDSFTDNTLHIRKGDSLRLTAHDPAIATEAATGTFTITGSADFSPLSSSSTTPIIHTFTTAGTHTLTATWTPVSGPAQTATVTLHVHTADFGPEFIVNALKPRTWTPPTLDPHLQIQADKGVTLYETTPNPQTDPRTFSIGVSAGANYPIIARLPADSHGAPSAILASGTIHGIYLAHADETSDAKIVTRYPDGTWLMSSSIVAVNLPPHAYLQITATQQGTLFTNGSNVLELHSTDFDANGIATIYFEWSGTGTPTLCHTTRTFLQP